jgi:hypothetical protein
MAIYDKLLKKGAVFMLDISIWGGRKKLKPEDIGMPQDEVNEKIMSLGSKYLVPKEEIQALHTMRARAYKIIDDSSIDIGVGKLVPSDKMEEVRRRLGELRDQFNEKIEYIRDEYPRMRADMMSLWNQEAIAVSETRHNPDLVFKIMGNIERAFPEKWEAVAGKFGFSWWESNKLDDVARQFVELAVEKVAIQISEFCNSIGNKVKDSGLHGNSLAAIQRWVDVFRDSVKVFESELLNSVLDTLEGQVSSAQESPGAFRAAMAALSEAVNDGISEIQADAVTRLTSQRGRNIEL